MMTKTIKTLSIALALMVFGCLMANDGVASQELTLPPLEDSPVIVGMGLNVSVELPSRCEASYQGTLVDVCHLYPGDNAVTFQVGPCYANGSQPTSGLQIAVFDYDGEELEFSLNTNKAGDGPISGIRGISLPDRSASVSLPENASENEQEERITRPRLSVSPNPFNPSVNVSFMGNLGEFALVRVYDLRGRLVNGLYSGPVRSRETSLVWKGRDERGRTMPSGVYFVHVFVEGRTEVKKVLLAK
jgi:hypothetical protein